MSERAFAVLDEQIGGLLAAAGTPGAAMALTDRDETLHCAAFGVADFVGDRPVAADTLFEIGSIGKSFTAIALLREVESGRLDLHAPVTRYLPWLEIRSRFEPITPHHLLNHTAGIINGRDFTGEGVREVWGLRETDAAWPPGSRFHYSNLGYKALGLVLEAVTGRSYAEVISERILEPLGMRSTDPVTTYETRTRQAVGHAPLRDDRPHVPGGPLVPAPWVETATGDGCIASTAADMAAYVGMLLNRALAPRVGAPDDTVRARVPYAYGLNIRPDGIMGHGG
jgi:CubicO group peptidase (beta-lactamase class C family)